MNETSRNHYYDKLQRLFQIVNLISNKNELTREDLAERCGGVSVKTISRDIKSLREMGYEIVFDNGSGYQFLEKDFVQVGRNFSSLEALVLMLSVRANTNLPPDLRDRIENKLLTVFPSYVERDLDELLDSGKLNRSESDSTVSVEVMDKLQQAIAEAREVEFEYRAAQSNERAKSHKVVPYAMVWKRDRCYLVGDLVYRDYSPINYRLDRMEELRLTGDFGEVPEEFDLDEYLNETWRMFGGEKQFVKVEFEPEAKHVFENRLGSKLEEGLKEEDGRFVFSGYIRGVEGLKSDLAGLGDKAEVLEPPELRSQIVAHARKLLEKYEKGETNRNS